MARKSSGTWIVPSVNVYVKDADLGLERNKPVAVRADIAKNLVENLHFAREAKADEIKEAEMTAETMTEVENAAND